MSGHYPDKLLSLWDQYPESENDRPGISLPPSLHPPLASLATSTPILSPSKLCLWFTDYFPSDQQYVIFEFGDGGISLESYKFKDAAEGLSVLLQVAWSLAVAEDAYQFEHRDLHWSNVLVSETAEGSVNYTFRSMGDGRHSVRCSGVKAHIIDFTLSRLTTGHDAPPLLYTQVCQHTPLL